MILLLTFSSSSLSPLFLKIFYTLIYTEITLGILPCDEGLLSGDLIPVDASLGSLSDDSLGKLVTSLLLGW